MRAALRQGAIGAAAWVVVGTLLRVVLGNWGVGDAVVRSLPGAVAVGAVYAYLVHRRSD